MENNFYNIFDSHAHYDDKWFDEDREVLLSSMKENGVCGIVNNAVDLKTAKVCIDFCRKIRFYVRCGWISPRKSRRYAK